LTSVIHAGTLPFSDIAREFIGEDHGVSGISFLLVEAPLGRGPRLHRHDYDEVIVVQEGVGRFTAGDQHVELTAGDTLVIPAGTPHTFVNIGSTVLRQVDIHASSRFKTVWLE
jgi:mannose-6-phosphate isomerase-like protein (cupin superfamily)